MDVQEIALRIFVALLAHPSSEKAGINELAEQAARAAKAMLEELGKKEGEEKA